MTGDAAGSLEELIEQITTWPVGMPVRAMERVRTMGEAAVPALAAALDRWQDDEERDLLWPIVLLGEIGHPDAIDPLIRQARRTDLDVLALAAAEALAKIGPPAVPALTEIARTGDPLQRLYAYAALGEIRDDGAYACLVQALTRDREMHDVLATALADQRRAEAIPLLYEAYRTSEPWQRADFEDTLRALHWGRHPGPIWTRDWRLRYRRLPAWGTFDPGWAGISAMIHRDPKQMTERAAIPLRSLEEIVEDQPELEEPPETCEECGAPVEHHTGLPACPETALSVAVYQLSLLNGAREDGIEDLFDMLDELEDQEEELRHRGEPRTPAARRRWHDEADELKMCRQTCQWLIEHGAETVGAAKAMILAKVAWLADRYGDPEGLLRPLHSVERRGPKVGRNDPCPCGSGRKYKHCCLGKA